MTPRRLLVLAVVSLPSFGGLLGSPAALGGEIVFSSDRCQDDADRERRRVVGPFPGPGGCVRALWRVDDQGGGLVRLTDGLDDGRNEFMESGDSSPAWSPDGSRIAFARLTAAARRSRIYLYENGAVRPVPFTPDTTPAYGGEGDGAPKWSPDGQLLVFSSRRANRMDRDIFLGRVAGGDPLALTAGVGDDDTPTFSPDGQRILFIRWPSIQQPPGSSETTLYSMKADGSDLAPVTLGGGGAVLGSAPTFSPDGQFVAITLRGAIYTMRADGSELQRRFQGQGPAFTPDWIEPGPAFVFAGPASARRPEPSMVLYRVDLASPGAQPRPLTPAGAFDQSPDWRPSTGMSPPAAVPDVSAPAVVLVDQSTNALVAPVVVKPRASKRAKAAGATVTALTKSAVHLLAIDRGGVRRVDLAVSRRAPRGRCRWLEDQRFGSARGCDKPEWWRVANESAWRERLSRLPPGKYRLRFRTADRLRNKTALLELAVRLAP